jgi:hypothetical protein
METVGTTVRRRTSLERTRRNAFMRFFSCYFFHNFIRRTVWSCLELKSEQHHQWYFHHYASSGILTFACMPGTGGDCSLVQTSFVCRADQGPLTSEWLLCLWSRWRSAASKAVCWRYTLQFFPFFGTPPWLNAFYNKVLLFDVEILLLFHSFYVVTLS